MINKMSKNKLIISYITILMPFIIYGVYKNGYLLYQNNLISFFNIFKPFYFLILAVIINLIIEYISNKKITVSFNLLYMILLSMIVSIRTNYISFIIIMIIFNVTCLYLDKKFKINYVCLFAIIFYLINLILNINLMNIAEMNYDYKLSILDMFLGRNIGGMASTNIFLSLISFVILSCSLYYKKYIPIIINGIYLFLSFIYLIIFNDYSLLLNSTVIFASIFIAPLPIYSPYSLKGIIIYSFIIGLLSFVFTLINPYIGIYISILIVSIFLDKLDNLLLKKSK